MNFKKYHVSANLIDADSYYGEYKSGNSYTATALQFNNKKIYPFNAADIGKKFTISCEITNLSSTNVRWQAVTGGETTDGVARSSVGVIQLTFTVVSIDDYIRITYGSGNALMTITNVMLNSGNTSLPYEPYGNTWHDIPHYIHNTSTDTITTLPAVLYPNAVTATVGLKGQAVQSSTPSPTSPVMPNGTGDRTENLFDGQWQQGYYAYSTGDYNFGDNYVCTHLIPCTENTTYTFKCISMAGGSNNYGYVFFDSAQSRIGSDYIDVQTEGDVVTHTATTPQNTAFLAIDIAYGRRQVPIVRPSDITNFMLNTGSTAKPYEPYGYKIPISSANTTTPVYLGEVESTRKIVKYEFTGQENWTYRSGQPSNVFFTELSGINYINNSMVCTHYPNQDSGSFDDMEDKHILLRVNSDLSGAKIAIRDTNFTDGAGAGGREELKAWLAQQYANGTPVTVWYVLATESTGIVNEPIRKIGTYADTVSGITIPTITGKDTFDVQTTLKPSEVELTYTGWHDATVKEWDGSDWQ